MSELVLLVSCTPPNAKARRSPLPQRPGCAVVWPMGVWAEGKPLHLMHVSWAFGTQANSWFVHVLTALVP